MQVNFKNLREFSECLHSLKNANLFDSCGEPNSTLAACLLRYLVNYIDDLLTNAKIFNEKIHYDSELFARNLALLCLEDAEILTNYSIFEEVVHCNDALKDF